ncbi:MAG: hypothetical protein LQ352_002933, partial [Teloschistes flavicans]
KFQNTKERTYLSIRDLAEMRTSIPTDRNIEGAHRSPENHGSHKGLYSGRKSDMWSYACVLVEVLTFALGSNNLLSDFRRLKAREDEDESDAFFTMGASALADGLNEYSVKLSVSRWLDVLGKRFLENRVWIDDVVKLILAVLKIVPEERFTAQQVYANFEHILEYHFQSINSDNRSLPNEVSKNENSSNHYDRKHRIGVWKFGLPGPPFAVKAWSLSPFGDRIAFLLKYRSYVIHIFSTIDEDDNTTPETIVNLPPGIDWQTLKIAHPYLSVLGGQSHIGTKMELRDLDEAKTIAIPHELASSSADISPSSNGLIAFCGHHSVILWDSRGLLVVEAKPETPKRKLQHAEKRFMQRQIAHAATDEHLVYIDINYNIHCWSLVRNDAQGCLELEGPDKILGRSHRFSGKITLAALSKADRTIIVTICSEKGEIEAQQYTLPIENRRIAITASIGFRGKICRGLRMLCNTPMSRRCIPR